METEFLLMRLELEVASKAKVLLDASDLKSVLTQVKNLERALADSLALLYAKRDSGELAA